MLMIPNFPGFLETTSLPTSTAATGTSIAAHATIHTKTASWTQLIADTGPRALGILILLDNTAVSNTNTSMLLDIGIGGSGAETVLIPDLAAGFILPQATSTQQRTYYFPLYIPANSRLSARSQAAITVDTVLVSLQLFQRPTMPSFVGTRVTAYGVQAASSRGVAATTGNSVFGTAAQLTASTTNPIKYMQAGLQANSRAALTDLRVFADIRIGTTVSIAGPLTGFADTGVESVDLTSGNRILQSQAFSLPAGIDLRWAVQHNSATASTYDMIIYGLD